MDVAELNIRADATDVDRANRSLDNIGRTARKTETATDRMNRENERANREYTEMQHSVDRATGAMRSLIGILGFSLGVREVIEYSDSWRSVNNQLRQVTNSEIELASARDELLGISKDTNSALSATVELYSNLYRSTRDLDVSSQKVAEITKTINNLFLAGGKSAAETDGAVRQLAQGLAAGALRGDEFNSVAEGAPRIMDALAASLNMTRGELREFAAEGGITSKALVEALSEYRDEAQRMADQTDRTFGQHMVNAKTNVTEFIGEMGAADTAVSALGEGIEFLSENLDDLIPIVGTAAVAIGGAGAYSLVTALGSVLMVAGGIPAALTAVGAATVYLYKQFDRTDAFMNELDTFASSLVDAMDAHRDLARSGGSLEDQMNSLANVIAINRTEIDNARIIYGEHSEQVATLRDVLNDNVDSLNAVTDATMAQSQAQVEQAETIETLLGKYNTWRQSQSKISNLVETETLNVVALRDGWLELRDTIIKLPKTYDELSDRMGTATFRMMGVSDTLTETERKNARERQRAYEESLEEIEQAERESARVRIDNWQRTHEYLTNSFLDIGRSGGSAWERIGGAASATIERILAEWAAVESLEFFGFSTPNGALTGTSAATSLLKSVYGMFKGSSLTSAATATGGAVSGVAGAAGLEALGLGAGATGAAGGGILSGIGSAASSAWGGITSAAAAIPGWGWALGGLAAAGALFDNDDGYKRSYAGFLTAPTASAEGMTFDVDPFASGFQTQGVAYRASVEDAKRYIDMFREIDRLIVEPVRALGGNVDLSAATLSGVGSDGVFGSLGTFLGRGGKTTESDIIAMLNMFSGELVNHVSGLNDELMAAISSSSSAEERIALLNQALEESGTAGEQAAKATKDAAAAMDKIRQEEERLLSDRLNIIGTLTDELENAIALQGSVRMSIYEAMGASPLHEIGVTVSGQIAQIEEQRRLIISAHEEEMRAEQRLHEQRLRSAQSLADAATDIRLGDMSNLNSPLKLDFAQENFRDLAAAAANGDMDAISRIQQAADQYISAADDMYASGAGRQEVVSEVLGVLDSLSVSLGQSTYDPAAANQSLINQLSALDSQLADISAGINDDIISQLENINVTLDELTPNLRDTLTGAIAQWVSSSNPGGNAIIDSLGGIKGSVDALPPEIAGYMSSAMGSWINSMLSQGAYSQVIADSISRGGLDESATNQYLGSQNMGTVDDYRSAYNPDVAAQDILDQISRINSQSLTEEEAFRKAHEAFSNSNVGSAQIAQALGITQTELLDAATSFGLPSFSGGGIASGPESGYLSLMHGTEAVVPLDRGAIPVRLDNVAANDGAMVREIQSLNSEVIRLRETVAMIGEDAAGQRDRQTRIESEMADELKRGNGRKSVGNIG